MRYVWDKVKKELVPAGKTPLTPRVTTRVDSYRGPDGEGVRVHAIKRDHPSIEAAGLKRDARGFPVVTTAAERDRIIEKFNEHEQGAVTLTWTKETEDDD